MSIAIDLSGKVAVVTGAGRGLGRAIALSLAQAGVTIALAARTLEQIEQVAAEIREQGGTAIAVPTDVTKDEDAHQLVEQTVNAFGNVHIVVNNAGIERAAPLLETTEEDWDHVMAVNLKGMFLVTRAAGPKMIQNKWGRVINMASVGGTIAGPNNASYHASKAGVILFTKSLALEWARHGITVNALAPGYFQTDMLTDLMKDEERLARFIRAIPLRRLGDPEELGPLTAFLCTDMAAYITGQAIIIDGGLSSI